MDTQTITITFCDRAENHSGMEQIGTFADNGFSIDDLFMAKKWFDKKGAITELFDLNYPIENMGILPNDEGYLLVVRTGVEYLLG